MTTKPKWNVLPAMAAAMLLASCTTARDEPQSPNYQFNDCPVQASRDWKAWIDAMPGPQASRTLHITGTVDLPTPAYETGLIPGPADRMRPPGQRFSLVLTPPEGPVAQVITPTPVKYAGKATYEGYRSISIGCAGKVIAEIRQIPTVH